MTNVEWGLLSGVVIAVVVLIQEQWHKRRLGFERDPNVRIGKHFIAALTISLMFIVLLPIFSSPEETEGLIWGIVIMGIACFFVLSASSAFKLWQKKRQRRRRVRP